MELTLNKSHGGRDMVAICCNRKLEGDIWESIYFDYITGKPWYLAICPICGHYNWAQK